jgi:murein DD-endopeptidase MepM/ murein hydrolase activator NlpD
MSAIATTRILHAPEAARSCGQRTPWVWPLPELDGLPPCILTPHRGPVSDYVEIGYSANTSPERPIPVLATQSGIVAYAGGSTLCIDHADGWSTQYDNLKRVLVRPTDRFRRRRKERVQAGDVIGHTPQTRPRIRFVLSRWTDNEFHAMDPAPWMRAWSVLGWLDVATAAHPRSQPSS